MEEPGGAYPAPIVGHARTAERLRGAEARASLERRRADDERFADVRLVPPTITFTDRLAVDGGDLTIELLPTPGHTDDHVSAWVPEIRLLLAGDAAEHPFPNVGDPTRLPALLDSLERLRALGAEVLVPCHGGTTHPDLLDRNRAYFERVGEAVAAAVAARRVPSDWRTRDDLDERVGLPYARALADLGERADTVADIYPGFHRNALRAALEATGTPDVEGG